VVGFVMAEAHTEGLESLALVDALAEKLKAHAGCAEGLLEAFPGAYLEVTGGPLTLADPYAIMLCQAVARRLQDGMSKQ
jgi:hypothetical protein